MPYTTEEIKTRLYRCLVQETEVKDKISGGIYKDRRPYRSNAEDIVINALPADNEYLQTAVLNMNCHVPYIRTREVDEQVLNHKRIGEISRMMLNILGDLWTEMFNTTVEYHSLIEDQGECFYNFRVRVRAFGGDGG